MLEPLLLLDRHLVRPGTEAEIDYVGRGFHGTTVPEVAKRARVAAGTIHHYFPSKEALVNALYRTWKEALARRVYTAFPPTATPREQST